MARADYCGNGVRYTAESTLIDVYDTLRIQTRAPAERLSPLISDAAWTPQGAYCMTKVRWLSLSQLVSVAASCKLRFADLFPLLESSPVDPRDVCGVKRADLDRSSV